MPTTPNMSMVLPTEGGDAERHIGMFAETMRRMYRKPVAIVSAKVKEDRLVGQILRQRAHFPVVPVTMRDLLTTANMIAPYMEAGQVVWPETMPEWFLDEMKVYDRGQHDDGVASALAALSYVFLHGMPARRKRAIFLWDAA